MNPLETALIEEIQELDEKVNKENFDVRYGVQLVDAVMELWKIRLLKQIDESNRKN